MSANLADFELFKPLELTPGLTLKNRMVFSPCTRARSDIKTRCPTDENVKYYAARASAGLIMSEGCAVSEQGYGWYGAPALYTDEQQEGWRKIVDAVHAKSGKMFLQLWHMGRQSHPSFHPSNEVASCSSSCYSTGRTHDAEGTATGFPTTRAMTLEEVRQVVEDHRKCAERAKAAGFDGVEFHGAGGYLIDEFLQTSTNTRTDQYGGSVENRFRFLRELIEAVTTVYPANRVGVRLSPNGVYGGMGSEDNYETFTYVITELSQMGLCYLATHDGFGFGRSDKCRVFTVLDLKTLFKGRVMATCSYTRDQAEGVLHAGVADLVGFGRPFLVNPDLPERFRNDLPLAEPLPYELFWNAKKGLEGYHFPAYDPKKAEADKEKQANPVNPGPATGRGSQGHWCFQLRSGAPREAPHDGQGKARTQLSGAAPVAHASQARPLCKDNGILLEAYSPLARTYKMTDPMALEIAKDVDATVQVLVAFSLANGFITLPKSVHEERQKSNLSTWRSSRPWTCIWSPPGIRPRTMPCKLGEGTLSRPSVLRSRVFWGRAADL